MENSRQGQQRLEPLPAWFVAIGLSSWIALIGVASASEVRETVDFCELRLVDDRGEVLGDDVSICRSGTDEECRVLTPDAESADRKFRPAFYRFEGQNHGPVTQRISVGEDGTCNVTLPRKASVSFDFEAGPARDLEVSFYRPDRDPRMFRPEERVPLDRPFTHGIPAGPYLVSLNERGWAPDLHLLNAAPGSEHEIGYRQREGWSVVIRTVADVDGAPVADAEVELRSIPGFGPPDKPEAEPRSRSLATVKSNSAGLVAVSGLRLSMAGALVRHPSYLDSGIPAISSEAGTFRVFETRLHTGGELAVRVEEITSVGEPVPVAAAFCDLYPPEYTDLEFPQEDRLHGIRADQRGICRARAIPAGRYSLKVTLPDEQDAYTVIPLLVEDGKIIDPTVTLRPIRVDGRVFRGDEGAEGYRVVFSRADRFETAGEVHPAGPPAVTDDSGEYELVLWSPGPYLAIVAGESTMAGILRLVEVHDDTSFDFELADIDLKGQVVDESGQPLPAATVTIRQGGMTRGLVLDEDARFSVPFRKSGAGNVELSAWAPGFQKTEPMQVLLEEGRSPDPVTLVLEPREWREGRILLDFGRPAVGAWISVHRIGPPPESSFPFETLRTDASGNVKIPAEPGPLRLFYGGPGCPLGFFDLPPLSAASSPATQMQEELPFEIHCREPSHLMLRLVTDDPELRGRVPMILRRDGVTIPQSAVEEHLLSLGLPTTTDGQGRIGLVALEPGSYEVFHGKATSTLNVAARYDAGKLTQVILGPGMTIEIEAVLDFR